MIIFSYEVGLKLKQMINSPLGVSEDVFVLNNKDGKNPEIFGLFSTTR